MLFITTYRTKPFLSRDKTKELMDTFAANGPGPGTTADYIAADGSCGVVISDNEDAAAAYAAILPYTPYVEYDSKVMLTIDEAVPHILASLA